VGSLSFPSEASSRSVSFVLASRFCSPLPAGRCSCLRSGRASVVGDIRHAVTEGPGLARLPEDRLGPQGGCSADGGVRLAATTGCWPRTSALELVSQSARTSYLSRAGRSCRYPLLLSCDLRVVKDAVLSGQRRDQTGAVPSTASHRSGSVASMVSPQNSQRIRLKTSSMRSSASVPQRGQVTMLPSLWRRCLCTRLGSSIDPGSGRPAAERPVPTRSSGPPRLQVGLVGRQARGHRRRAGLAWTARRSGGCRP
jgi:hypothetical protein